jgi:ribose-phosphate pyrophosphokinase
MSLIVLPFPEDVALATAVASRLGARLGRLEWRHFPDGESLLAIGEEVADADVVLFCNLKQPDQKAIPLRFAAQTARELGARSVGLIAPYLAYMRQDKRFHAGEAISANVFARFLDETVDWLVTVDPHLHRIHSLDSLFRIPATLVSAAPAIAGWIRREVPRPLLIGPDSESSQWVADVARDVRAPYEVLHKVRRGDRDVEVSLPRAEHLRGYTPVLVDDIVSSGRTLVATLGHLHRLGMPPAVCVAIHPVFAGDAWQVLQDAGAGRVVSTDSIAHASNAISLAIPIAQAVAERMATGTREVVQ